MPQIHTVVEDTVLKDLYDILERKQKEDPNYTLSRLCRELIVEGMKTDFVKNGCAVRVLNI